MPLYNFLCLKEQVGWQYAEIKSLTVHPWPLAKHWNPRIEIIENSSTLPGFQNLAVEASTFE